MGVGPSTRPPGSATMAGRPEKVERISQLIIQGCPRVTRSANRTNHGRVRSWCAAIHGGSHGAMIGRRSGSWVGDA